MRYETKCYSINLAYFLLTVYMLFLFVITLMFVYLQKPMHCLIINSYRTNSLFSPCPKNLRSIGPYNFKNLPKVTQVCFSLLTYYLIWYITLMMIFIVRIVQLRPFPEMPLWLLLLYMFLQHVSLFWPLWVSFYDYFEVVFTYRYSTDLSYLCINLIFKTIR